MECFRLTPGIGHINPAQLFDQFTAIVSTSVVEGELDLYDSNAVLRING